MQEWERERERKNDLCELNQFEHEVKNRKRGKRVGAKQ